MNDHCPGREGQHDFILTSINGKPGEEQNVCQACGYTIPWALRLQPPQLLEIADPPSTVGCCQGYVKCPWANLGQPYGLCRTSMGFPNGQQPPQARTPAELADIIRIACSLADLTREVMSLTELVQAGFEKSATLEERVAALEPAPKTQYVVIDPPRYRTPGGLWSKDKLEAERFDSEQAAWDSVARFVWRNACTVVALKEEA